MTMNDFFEKYWQGYRGLINADRPAAAINDCLTLLSAYRDGGAIDYQSQHKGTPFYVMGYAAFACHDYTGASMYFDAAVAEDLRRPNPDPNTPAMLFMRLEDKSQDPYLATNLVLGLQAAVDELIQDYTVRSGAAPITLGDVRTRFLEKTIASPDFHKRALVTAFISFVSEWKYRVRMISLVGVGSREPLFLHLFRGCLLFESLLKENPKTPITDPKAALGGVLKTLDQDLGIGQKLDTSCSNFDAEINNLKAAATVEEAITTTGRIRNTVGHNLSRPSGSLNGKSYDLAVKQISSACIHAISKLYP